MEASGQLEVTMHTSATSEFHPGRERPRSGELCNQCLRKEVNGECDT